MVDVPAETPLTAVVVPVAEPKVTVALLLVQVPPGVPSVRVMDEPWQTVVAPLIAKGAAFTVTRAVT
jgi:hypothetical protein